MKRTVAIPTLLAALGAAMLSACSSTPSNEQNPAAVENRSSESSNTGIKTVDTTNVGQKGLTELTDPKSILSKRSIYFDYDKYDIKPEFKELVSAHAKYLSSHKEAKVLIQGNTDERGSREYNLALGQKRADAVKKGLVLVGAKEEQVESVSLGEEKPKADGHDEAAWAQNRRGDILYGGEY